jgi:hypothetical protein
MLEAFCKVQNLRKKEREEERKEGGGRKKERQIGKRKEVLMV